MRLFSLVCSCSCSLYLAIAQWCSFSLYLFIELRFIHKIRWKKNRWELISLLSLTHALVFHIIGLLANYYMNLAISLSPYPSLSLQLYLFLFLYTSIAFSFYLSLARSHSLHFLDLALSQHNFVNLCHSFSHFLLLTTLSLTLWTLNSLSAFSLSLSPRSTSQERFSWHFSHAETFPGREKNITRNDRFEWCP